MSAHPSPFVCSPLQSAVVVSASTSRSFKPCHSKAFLGEICFCWSPGDFRGCPDSVNSCSKVGTDCDRFSSRTFKAVLQIMQDFFPNDTTVLLVML